MAGVLYRLMEVLDARKASAPAESYTARLYAGGVGRIGSKIEEEAHEVSEAAAEPGEQGRRHLIDESSDLIYHLLVMLAYRGVTLEEVERELARRFGRSGLESSVRTS